MNIKINDVVINFELDIKNKDAYIQEIIHCKGKNETINCIKIPEKVSIRVDTDVINFTVIGFNGDCRFYSLKKIIIPKTIKYLNSYLFCNNTSIEEVILSKEVDIIYTGCFKNCKNLKSIEIPKDSKLRIIDSEAFRNCENLKAIYFPPDLECIYNYAFCNSGLENIKIPKNVYLKSGSFSSCGKLNSVIFTAENIFEHMEINSLIFSKSNKVKYSFNLGKLLKKYPFYRIDTILNKAIGKSVLDFINLIHTPKGLIVGPLLNSKGLNTYSGNLFIPSEVILEYNSSPIPIIGIEDFAFSSCPELREVEINESINFNKDLVFFNTNCNVKIITV